MISSQPGAKVEIAVARGRVVAEGVEAGSSASLDGEVAGEASFKQPMYCSTLR